MWRLQIRLLDLDHVGSGRLKAARLVVHGLGVGARRDAGDVAIAALVVVVALVGRLTLADRPFGGVTAFGAVAALAMAGGAHWKL
jgi:hypothetical protein